MFVDLLDPSRTAFQSLEGELANRILLELMQKEETRHGNSDVLNDVTRSRYYHPVWPTLTRRPSNQGLEGRGSAREEGAGG